MKQNEIRVKLPCWQGDFTWRFFQIYTFFVAIVSVVLVMVLLFWFGSVSFHFVLLYLFSQLFLSLLTLFQAFDFFCQMSFWCFVDSNSSFFSLISFFSLCVLLYFGCSSLFTLYLRFSQGFIRRANKSILFVYMNYEPNAVYIYLK